ncbi:MAG: type I-E CRISPR-associated protein Cse2/CasB [Ignavibacteriaceae bacterium]|nr:type I-E CRISPR-associated protein Cse2/CasB [Ignavibacteriaceae bacterium]
MSIEILTQEFCNELIKLNDNKAAMAELKRGLAHPPGEYPPQYKYLIPIIPWKTNQYPWFLTASLYGLHPVDTNKGNIGTSFRELKKITQSESIDLRFNSLLQCKLEDLYYHLRNAVSLFSSAGVPVNYKELLKSLLNWENDSRFVQINWAKEFWLREQTNNNQNKEK